MAAQLELLQGSVAQLTVTLAEVGARTHIAGGGTRDHHDLADVALPAKTQAPATFTLDAPEQGAAIFSATPPAGAIFSATPPAGAIFHASPKSGAMVYATPQVATMMPVMVAPMSAGAPYVAANVAAGSPRARAVEAAVAADADWGVALPLPAGAAGAPRSGAGAAAALTSFVAKGGDWADFQARFLVAYQSLARGGC
ncbi:unnamed protein product [Lampetra fluviatilis]